MWLQTNFYLLVAVCLILDTGLVASDCEYDFTIECLTQKSQQVLDLDCTREAEFSQELDNCQNPIGLISCTEEQKSELMQKTEDIREQIYNRCKPASTTTTTTTEMPLPDCGSDEGWQYANDHIVDCRKKFDKLTKYEYATKLTKYGICKNSQDLLNCLLGDERLNQCDVYKESFYRELIPHVKFAHLFDCDLKLEGKSIPHHNANSDCNFWSWLTCHDGLFSALPGLDTVNEGFDLNKIITYDVPSITRGLATDKTQCSSYQNVIWSDITQCRDDMAETCSILSAPKRDTMWSAVLSLMYEIKTNVYDKLTTLITINDICAEACSDIITRINKINNECKADADGIPQKVINNFNNGNDVATDCSELDKVKTCFKEKIIGNCAFLEQSVVLNLHSDNTWVQAFDICKIDLGIKSDGVCTAEQQQRSRILDKCSFQTSISSRENLLKRDFNASVFCSLLQKASDCYALQINRCPALEREYWLAELPLMAAANQLIAGCHVSYSTFGETKLLPVDQSDCDVKKWVGCLNNLWSALGIQISNNVLSVDGFKEYLALVWNTGDLQDQKDRCSKLTEVDFDAMEVCVNELSMNCQYPMLTIPDREDHELHLRNPFDIGQLKTFVQSICATECTESDVGEQFKRCIDVSHEAKILNSYPQDIIASSYRNQYQYAKCSDLRFTKSCIQSVLDPASCVLFQPGIVNTEVISEAINLCQTTKPKPTPPSTETNDSAEVVASAVFVLLSAILVIVFNL